MPFQEITPPEYDVDARAISRTLLQFRKSPVFEQLLLALVREVKILRDALNDSIKLRGPAEATNEQLNAIGRIVGQDRVVFDYSLIPWFAPDTEGQGADQAPAWCIGAPLTESLEVDDVWYRSLIESKVYRNFAKYGSVPEVQLRVKSAFGVDVSFFTVGPMEAELVLQYPSPLYVQNFLLWFRDLKIADKVPFPPYPETLRITGVYHIIDDYFAPDVPARAPDLAKAAVKYSV